MSKPSSFKGKIRKRDVVDKDYSNDHVCNLPSHGMVQSAVQAPSSRQQAYPQPVDIVEISLQMDEQPTRTTTAGASVSYKAEDRLRFMLFETCRF